MTLANKVTLLRMMGIPFFMVLLVFNDFWCYLGAFLREVVVNAPHRAGCAETSYHKMGATGQSRIERV